jgi:membrane dipeptidase
MRVFDGHNDFLYRLHGGGADRGRMWRDGQGAGHLSRPLAQAGGFAGGLFAIFVPGAAGFDSAGLSAAMDAPPYDIPLPDPVPLADAQVVALRMAADLTALDGDGFRLCRTVADITAAMDAGDVAGVMHMEGADAIDPACDVLPLFHAMGLRSLGPVWSRPNAFGHGVPFAFPADPDRGPGLTDAGRRLVRACNRLRIMLDVSHLNAAGFDDLAALTDAPIVATHSNAHAVTPSSRNLTDRQLRVIADSGGLVGLNFATVFLRADGREDADCGWDPMLRHLDHLIGILGPDGVAFGSDFDGATVPAVLRDAGGLPGLIAAMAAQGYGPDVIERIAWRNWLRVLQVTWGA